MGFENKSSGHGNVVEKLAGSESSMEWSFNGVNTGDALLQSYMLWGVWIQWNGNSGMVEVEWWNGGIDAVVVSSTFLVQNCIRVVAEISIMGG